jgi:hypothetical protein
VHVHGHCLAISGDRKKKKKKENRPTNKPHVRAIAPQIVLLLQRDVQEQGASCEWLVVAFLQRGQQRRDCSAWGEERERKREGDQPTSFTNGYTLAPAVNTRWISIEESHVFCGHNSMHPRTELAGGAEAHGHEQAAQSFWLHPSALFHRADLAKHSSAKAPMREQRGPESFWTVRAASGWRINQIGDREHRLTSGKHLILWKSTSFRHPPLSHSRRNPKETLMSAKKKQNIKSQNTLIDDPPMRVVMPWEIQKAI